MCGIIAVINPSIGPTIVSNNFKKGEHRGPDHTDFNIIDTNIYICMNCSTQQTVLKNVSSYRDIDRVNIGNKYLYDRKIHFRDSINQYQGKQNSTIPKKVYDDL